MKRMMNNRVKKSNKVSWAPGFNFCKVKLFVSEDCPSKVGVEPQDHLQVKTSWILHSSGRESDDPPPGFERSHCVNDSREQLTHIPRIKWKCPAEFVHNWLVAAGEESKEVEAQRQREMSVFEAMYPRSSDTPPSPFVSLDVKNEIYNDSQTPLIPITPIEEEEEAVHISSNLTAPVDTPISSQPQALLQGSLSPASEKPAPGILTGLSNDAVIAAAIALTTVMKNMEQGSMIDTDLLVKILSDPKMVEKLINDNGASATNGSAATPTENGSAPAPTENGSAPAPAKNGSTPAKAVSAPMFASELVTGSIPLPCPKPAIVSSPMLANRNFCPVSNGVQPTLIMTPPRPDTVPVSVLKPSLPLSSPQTNMLVAPRPPNGNLLAVINQVQPTLSSRAAQFNFFPKAQLTLSPKVHPTLSMKPAQPNSAPKVQPTLFPKVQPTLSMMPAQPNSAPQVQPTLSIMPAQPNSAPMMQPALFPKVQMMPAQPNSAPKVVPILNTMPLQPIPVPNVQPMLSMMPLRPHSVPVSSFAANPGKDVNYIKQLIREHGVENQQNWDRIISQPGNHDNHLQNLKLVQNLIPGELKSKYQKPCMYFNTPKGCWNGASCPFLHGSFQFQTGSTAEAPSAKRIKLGGEIAGRS